jgi:hypothetical protein
MVLEDGAGTGGPALPNMSFHYIGSFCVGDVSRANTTISPAPSIELSWVRATVLPKISGTMQTVLARTEAAELRKHFETISGNANCFSSFA